jgi:DNA-binding transcriptional MerR regulator
MTMGAQDSFTIDELAAAAGMTPRNVRAYRTKGLLFPPIRVGRTSQYRTAHLHRLRDIHRLREAGLPLKMIIEAANRGEDLGPNGALWLAAGRVRQAVRTGGNDAGAPAFVEDPEVYEIMQTLTGRGLTPSTVLLLALQAARTSSALAAELGDLLSAQPGPSDVNLSDVNLSGTNPAGTNPATEDAPTVSVPTEVIDLATVITREMLAAPRPRAPGR